MKVKCPKCRREVEYTPANPFRPFCSERCQTLDLGAWADEQYRVPVEGEPALNEGEPRDKGAHTGDPAPPKHQLN